MVKTYLEILEYMRKYIFECKSINSIHETFLDLNFSISRNTKDKSCHIFRRIGHDKMTSFMISLDYDQSNFSHHITNINDINSLYMPGCSECKIIDENFPLSHCDDDNIEECTFQNSTVLQYSNIFTLYSYLNTKNSPDLVFIDTKCDDDTIKQILSVLKEKL